MDNVDTVTKTISLNSYGIKNSHVHYQLSPSELSSFALSKGQAIRTSSGALSVLTGAFTGRSPKDRYIVKDELTETSIDWGVINIPFDASAFDELHNKIIDFIAGKELFVRDCYASAHKSYRIPIRVINEYSWSNLFVYNMFLRPEVNELYSFEPEWTVINIPSFKANSAQDGTRSSNFSIINFTKKIILIGGSGYTGEIKKAMFSVLNFTLPTNFNVLPMHCSVNSGANGEAAIFFGLSGTGKTTLSTDASRQLVGDDEHGWTSNNEIFNFEGGCYAKVINLDPDSEPEIYDAIKEGALLENVITDSQGVVNFSDTSITQNTRVSYPINYLANIKIPSLASNPKHIFFLTADAFGVLPPISKLNASQVAYHFISGYTAKVAGTEEGVLEPRPEFSACFGAPFMPLHPAKYAKMLIDKMENNNVNVWLVNTGWSGGRFGVGKRIKLKYTRALINAALDGSLEKSNKDNYHIHSVFNVKQPRTCPNVPDEILSPRKTWNNDEAYYKTAYTLVDAFYENFQKFEKGTDIQILKGAPNKKE